MQQVSRHCGAFKSTLVQFRQVGANDMVVDVGHGREGGEGAISAVLHTVHKKLEELGEVASVGIQGMGEALCSTFR